jgi:alpha-L-rhamnosidase
MAIESLTAERRSNPLGIDTRQPRFAWRSVGTESTAQQTAYQLQVIDADNPAATWSAPTWDSGRVESSESTYVVYGGPPLVSRHRYAWRVRTWKGDGSESTWSTAGVFEMGLLAAADWSARWIAHVVRRGRAFGAWLD